MGEEEVMKDEELLTRITVNPAILGGTPIIRGMRVAVEHVLGMLAAGSTPEETLEGYPYPGKGGHSGLSSICIPHGGARAR